MPKTSILADKDKFQEAASNTKTIKEFLTYLDLRAGGGNFKQAHKYSEAHGIPLPKHEPTGVISPLRIPDNEVFVLNSSYTNRASLKKRLILLGYKYECSIEECPITDSWLGKPVSLHLDHINGVHNDNRLENLRFLCPNCHSQTSTYSGKKTKIKTIKPRKSKIDWPEIDKLQEMVDKYGYSKTGRMLNVSDSAVRKHLNTRQLRE